MIAVDLHVHSLKSFCGNHTIWELLNYGRQIGIKGFALTDHGPALGKNISQAFFQRFTNPFKDIKLFLGMECNLISNKGEIDLPLEILEYLDIVLLGLHFNTPKGQGVKANTNLLIKAIEKNPFVDIITHPNDPTYPVDFEALAFSAQNHGVALELNNSKNKYNFTTKELTTELLRACVKNNCQIAVNSDTHVITELGDNSAAKVLLNELDFPLSLIINRDLYKASSFIDKRKKFKTI